VRQHYFGEVIALRHRAGHGTSLSNAAIAGRSSANRFATITDGLGKIRFRPPGRIGTRKEISVQGQICAQEASWLPMPKEKVGFAPSRICKEGSKRACGKCVIETGGPAIKHLFLASLSPSRAPSCPASRFPPFSSSSVTFGYIR